MSGGSPGDRSVWSWVCRVVLRAIDWCGEVMGMSDGCHGDQLVRSCVRLMWMRASWKDLVRCRRYSVPSLSAAAVSRWPVQLSLLAARCPHTLPLSELFPVS